MKKNKIKNVNWYKESVKKYKFGFLTYNIVIFAIVFALFVIVLTFFVEERFLNNVQEEILKIERKVDSSNGIDYSISEDDPRLTVVYYYAEPKAGSVESFVNPKITNRIIVGSLSYNDVTSIDDISKEREDGFLSNEIKGHQYLSLSTKTWKLTRLEDDSIALVIKVKIYMNIDGELHAKRELGTSIILSMLFIMLIGVSSSFLIMRRSMKPINEFVEKQIAFVSDASHELKTPLAIIQSKVENILANPKQSVYDVSEDLAISLKELTRLNKLTHELLTLARSDDKKLNYNFEKVNLNVILEEIVEPFIEIASFEDRTLEYKGEDILVSIDKDKFRELMIILLDNALKYTNCNDSINVVLRKSGNDAEILVLDTGIGISSETKNKIFERFYREDKARSRETGGNGLGLSIAKSIVTDMKGKIHVEHNQPKGTVFVISFPRTK